MISAYSSTNTEQEDIVDEFYDEMRRANSTVPRHNVVVALGDFNARVASTDGRFTFHEETNKSGENWWNLI